MPRKSTKNINEPDYVRDVAPPGDINDDGPAGDPVAYHDGGKDSAQNPRCMPMSQGVPPMRSAGTLAQSPVAGVLDYSGEGIEGERNSRARYAGGMARWQSSLEMSTPPPGMSGPVALAGATRGGSVGPLDAHVDMGGPPVDLARRVEALEMAAAPPGLEMLAPAVSAPARTVEDDVKSAHINEPTARAKSVQSRRHPGAVGLGRGGEGQQVQDLQMYLARLGYLDHFTKDGHAAFEQTTSAVFDSLTEEALKRYQEFHGLSATGVLDAPTAEMMRQPRCGNPDVPRSAFRNRDVGVRSDFAPMFTTFPKASRWDHKNLRYGFANVSPDLTAVEVRQAVSQAFRMWSEVTWLTFTEVGVGEDPEIVFRFVTGAHGERHSPFAGTSDPIIAHGFSPPPDTTGDLAGDVCFDEAETWSVASPRPSGSEDLVHTAAHEIGHALGLDHSSDTSALMASNANYRRSLHKDDIDGITFLYGPRRGWNYWSQIGDSGATVPIRSVVTPTSRNANDMALYVVGSDGGIYTTWWDGAWQHPWSPVAGGGNAPPRSVVTALVRHPNATDLFVVGHNGGIYTNSWETGRDWSGWSQIGDASNTVPTHSVVTAASRNENDMALYVVGHNGGIYTTRWDGAWRDPWSPVAGGGNAPPRSVVTALVRHPNATDLFVVGHNGGIYTNSWDTGRDWSGWSQIGDASNTVPTHSVVAAASRNENDMALYVVGHNGGIYTTWWDGAWRHPWSQIGGAGNTVPQNSVVTALVRHPSATDLFVVGHNGGIYSNSWTDSQGWSGWFQIGNEAHTVPINSVVTAESRVPTEMRLFVVGDNGGIYSTSWAIRPPIKLPR